jgi:glycosyltransferase involved in cell wall biosynthesis
MTHGMMRVRNESRWIGDVVRALQQCCDRVFIFDDRSTDATPAICEALGCKVIRKTTGEVDETDDKNKLLRAVWSTAAVGDWCVHIDGDELIHPADIALVRNMTQTTSKTEMVSFRVLYLWDDAAHVRVDGVYGRFHRPSMFRLKDAALQFQATTFGGNLHCGNVPTGYPLAAVKSEVRLLHHGYMDRADRVRKYNWYNAVDPNNLSEDCYRHMVLGDLPYLPAGLRTLHAGPLTVRPL